MADHTPDTETAAAPGTDPVDGATAGEAPERAPNTLLNGLVGGVVAVLLSFLPFSTVLGGAVAGYLEGGDTGDGAKVGAIAGLVSFVPIALFVAVIGLFVPVVTVVDGSGPAFGAGIAVWLGLAAVLVVVAIYALGFSILGGVIGAYLKEHY
jgi:hypothetical protein